MCPLLFIELFICRAGRHHSAPPVGLEIKRAITASPGSLRPPPPSARALAKHKQSRSACVLINSTAVRWAALASNFSYERTDLRAPRGAPHEPRTCSRRLHPGACVLCVRACVLACLLACVGGGVACVCVLGLGVRGAPGRAWYCRSAVSPAAGGGGMVLV